MQFSCSQGQKGASEGLSTRVQQGGQTQLGGPSGLLHTPGFGPVDFQWKGLPAGPPAAPFGTSRVVRLLQKSRGELRACQTGAESRICWGFQWGYKFHPSRNEGPSAAEIPQSGLPFPARAGSSGWQRSEGRESTVSTALKHLSVRGAPWEASLDRKHHGAGLNP